jgi:hypothetical protein
VATEIVKPEELANYMEVDEFNEESPEQAILDAANQFVETYCGREFAADSVNRIEFVDIIDCYTNRIRVKKPPIISLTSLQQGLTSPTLVDATSYYVDKESGVIKKILGYFIEGVAVYKITYKGGYTAIPNDLKLVVKRIAAREIMKEKKQRHGLRGVGFVQGNSEFYLDNLEMFERNILAEYEPRI